MKLRLSIVMSIILVPILSMGADWTQFRGPGGLGVSQEKGVPLRWSSQENIVWKKELPGPGSSSPITLRGRVFVTCYSGFGLKPSEGDETKLKRHLLCVDQKTGATIWSKQFDPQLPEHKYRGEGS